ncbi:MAG: DNA-protecting protein DprA [Candidatus Eisenbacteria bacterium]|nr:DNA-protecting protein DprA [Candidatus Eisenbacteria bacterium]
MRGEPGYPDALLDLRDAPARVWLSGAPVPARERCVAIVGSRAASPYGTELSRRLAADLAALGLTVVSGLARGIDAAAHQGALSGAGATIAVLPSGLDRVTPEHHATLAADVARRGTLLSEFAAGPPFGPGAFVRRNRLIAALAEVLVVSEAAERSGALTTAAAARALGRTVLAVPGDADRPTSRGTLALLRTGARPCADAGDVLAALRAVGQPAQAADPAARLAAALDGTPRTLDDLAARARMEPQAALAELLRLEWAGIARARPGQRWIARP